MKNILKKAVCIVLCLTMCFGFSGCSSNELTEDNVTQTVEKVEKALKNLNITTLQKYARSETISSFSGYLGANGSTGSIDLKTLSKLTPFIDLCDAIFENMTMEVVSIDLEAQTVDVAINNKDLYTTTCLFAYYLKKDYSTQQLLNIVANEEKLEKQVDALLEDFEEAEMMSEPQIVTLKIEQGENNLILVFDKDAEHAVTSGVVTAFLAVFHIDLE